MKYRLEIFFKTKTVSMEPIIIKSEYKKNYQDTISLFSERIEIDFERTKNIDLKAIIENANHTIHSQIYIALIYRWVIQQSKIDIAKIEISKEKDIFSPKTIADIYPDSIAKYGSISKSKLDSILQKNTKNSKLVIAINHYIKGLSVQSMGNRFDYFWKSFNSLYSVTSSQTKEIDRLIDTKHYIWTNKTHFIETMKLISPIKKDELRELRIRDMILNDYPSTKIGSFKDFILRYNDVRVCGIFKDTLPYRSQELRNHRMYSLVDNHLANQIQNNLMFDEQVLTFIVIKYSYYLRNMYFHAEKLNEDFRLFKSKENMGLKKINTIFESFLYELIGSVL